MTTKPPTATPRRLTPNERARIRARSGLAEETVTRIELGKPVKEASLLRCERAVAEEGIDLDDAKKNTNALPKAS